jgi:DNA repair protein RecN (Recombination protein N)
MLRHLHIRNYALIDTIDIDFERGLNILTGETGAGKSILIGAIGLILGERASSESVREHTDKAIIEATFGIDRRKDIPELLEENQIDWMEPMIIRREVTAGGQSRCFVNDTPTTIKTLKGIGELLVDLHGQHEHQSLLRTGTHCRLLDDFGGLSGIVGDFRDGYRSLHGLFTELRELLDREESLRERKDLLAFQIKEIDSVAPQADEESSLETELTILENAETLYEQTQQLYELLYESDRSVYENIVIARNRLESLADIDPAFNDHKNECSSAEAIVHEIAQFLQRYNSRIEFDPERLEIIRDRLGQLSLLKKKYGGSLESVLERRDIIGAEFALAENFGASIESLRKNIAAARAGLSTIAERLSTKRRETAKKIGKTIVKELAALGIPNAQFETRIETAGDSDGSLHDGNAYVKLGNEYFHAAPNGIDRIEFYISTNTGESPRPLARVASGGEISRIMLAIKSVLAKSERLPLLIFDEIDVGVSGRIAQAVGKSLKHLSGYHQVIAITHLPQIAGLADAHFVVEKSEEGKRTATSVRKLTDTERVREVARLLSGEEITEAGLTGAKELMKTH